MRNIIIISLIVPILSISSLAWAASCERRYEWITDGHKYCETSKLKKSRDLSKMKSREEQVINTIKSSRVSYKNALTEPARVYDNYLSDYAQAVRNYEMALETCKETEYLKIARPRLDELRKQGY